MGKSNLSTMGKVREVKSLKAVGALVTSEANSMSLLRFRMRLADEAMWADVGFYKDKGISEQNKHGRGTEQAWKILGFVAGLCSSLK